MPPLEVRYKVLPTATGLLLQAVAFGFVCTVTQIVALPVQPDAFVTVTVYVPDVHTEIVCVVAPVDHT